MNMINILSLGQSQLSLWSNANWKWSHTHTHKYANNKWMGPRTHHNMWHHTRTTTRGQQSLTYISWHTDTRDTCPSAEQTEESSHFNVYRRDPDRYLDKYTGAIRYFSINPSMLDRDTPHSGSVCLTVGSKYMRLYLLGTSLQKTIANIITFSKA